MAEEKRDYDAFIKELTDKYENLDSRITNFYRLRKERGLNYPAPREWIDYRKKKTNESLKQTKVKQFTSSEVEKLMDLSGQSGTVEDAIELMAITGRRIGEIVKGKFRVVGGILQYTPLKKESQEWCSIEQFTKSMSPKDILKRIKVFQKNNKVKTTKLFTEQVNRYLGKNFTTIKTSHDLRKIYAQTLVKNVRPSLKSLYIKDLLCHSNVTSSIHYNQAEILPAEGEVKEEVEEEKEEEKEEKVEEVVDEVVDEVVEARPIIIKRGGKWYCTLCDSSFVKPQRHRRTAIHQQNIARLE